MHFASTGLCNSKLYFWQYNPLHSPEQSRLPLCFDILLNAFNIAKRLVDIKSNLSLNSFFKPSIFLPGHHQALLILYQWVCDISSLFIIYHLQIKIPYLFFHCQWTIKIRIECVIQLHLQFLIIIDRSQNRSHWMNINSHRILELYPSELVSKKVKEERSISLRRRSLMAVRKVYLEENLYTLLTEKAVLT